MMNEAERRAWLQKMKPRMVEILDNACAPGTVIDPDELHRDVEIARTEFYSEAKARKLYGKDAEQCICGEWTHSGGHFDGTYFTCDPEAECNKPGFEAALAQQAQPLTDARAAYDSTVGMKHWYSAEDVRVLLSAHAEERKSADALIADLRDRMAQQTQPEGAAWMQATCNNGGTGHLFMAYVRSGESIPYLCNEHNSQ